LAFTEALIGPAFLAESLSGHFPVFWFSQALRLVQALLGSIICPPVQIFFNVLEKLSKLDDNSSLKD